jgi:hypothetical protein
MPMSKLLPAKTLRYRTIQAPFALKLPFPVNAQMRLAVLSDTAPVFGLLAPFKPELATQLEGFRPNLIAGTVAEFEQLAEQVDLDAVTLSCLDHAVIVLTRCGNAPLSDVARVVFWQAFGVPVYEVFTGLDDTILAYECELHEGWHLAPRIRLVKLNGELMLEAAGVAGLHTGLSGVVTDDECPCGRTGRRVLNLEPVKRLNRGWGWAAIA